MRYQSYFNTAVKLIHEYDGATPLQHFLKNYFAQHKKHGSKDRKIITHLCYNFFRLGQSFQNITAIDKLKIALFICNDSIEDWQFLYETEWLINHSPTLNERITFIQTKYAGFSLQDIFPFVNELSEGIDIYAFTQSFLVQPDVFIRIRPGYFEKVVDKLQQNNIVFSKLEEDCLSLSPLTKIDTVISIDEEAVIQDHSSQQVKNFLEITEEGFSYQPSAISKKNSISVWDCCAGSGGKSLLAYDSFENIELTVSDIRSSILQNLKQRFAKAGIKNYKAFVNDLAEFKSQIPNPKSQIPNPKYQISKYTYDLIICDAPCTGSGTWGRTPEQLYFFYAQKVNEYALRQQKIVSAAIQSLKNNGYFLYITCSVFKEENEKIAAYIQQLFNLELLKIELIKGYDKKADTMFAALFKKPAS